MTSVDRNETETKYPRSNRSVRFPSSPLRLARRQVVFNVHKRGPGAYFQQSLRPSHSGIESSTSLRQHETPVTAPEFKGPRCADPQKAR